MSDADTPDRDQPDRDQYTELCRLIQSLYDECITPAEREKLEDWLCRDKEARRIYAQYMNLFAALYWEKSQFSETEEIPSRAEFEPPRSPVLGLLGDCFQWGTSFLYRSNVFTLLVAIGLPVAAILLVMVTMIHQVPPSPVAMIARSRDYVGRLDDRPSPLCAGHNLFAKQRLVVDEGLVEIQFADGAAAVLEGPAVFEILGGNAGLLTKGRLAAVVPPEARGFAVATPTARVVDLGTEFGVWVDDDGQVEAHVFGGQVEVMVPVSVDSPGRAARLGKGEAVQIAVAHTPGKSPRIVRIPAVAKQFTRSVALPEPTILFAHRGSADPATEGWTAQYRQYGEGLPRDGKKLGQLHLAVGPVDGAGTDAWRVRPLYDGKQVSYEIRDFNGLTPELRAEAREEGWVLRTRVWISDKGPLAKQEPDAPCYIVYRDEERWWRFWILVDHDGNQYVRGTESEVGPFPGSRNQYVDYEFRYDPVKKNVALFVNGRGVGTHKGSPNLEATGADDGAFPVIRFGTYGVPAEVRFAQFEWGILRDTEKE